MSTTTIRLSEDLKTRVQRAAKSQGLTPHALILEAIAEKTESSERRAAFYDMAETRLTHLAESGKSVSWDDMRGYLKARINGGPAKRPKSRKIAGPRD